MKFVHATTNYYESISSIDGKPSIVFYRDRTEYTCFGYLWTDTTYVTDLLKEDNNISRIEQWTHYGETHRINGPAYIRYDMDGNPSHCRWFVNGFDLNWMNKWCINRHMDPLNLTDDDRIIIIMELGNRK